jgi:light-regulated signal transduction histidine kinase (bacteriophytochrome)
MVGNYTQLLARRYKDKLDAEAEEFISFAVNGVTRMQALVNDLLEYSRVGRRGKEFALTNCEKVLCNVLQQLKTSIEETKGVVTHNILPSVFADHSQLEQLFQNLIANSLKFHGKDLPKIHISAEEDVNHWIFSVADNGIGIDSQYSERIFLIFQRLHTCVEYPGTGIGLAICKKIIEHHGGRIWVKSAVGNGCTFFFTIPKIKESRLISLSSEKLESFKSESPMDQVELHSMRA